MEVVKAAIMGGGGGRGLSHMSFILKHSLKESHEMVCSPKVSKKLSLTMEVASETPP
jgi:hypothetical protein